MLQVILATPVAITSSLSSCSPSKQPGEPRETRNREPGGRGIRDAVDADPALLARAPLALRHAVEGLRNVLSAAAPRLARWNT